MHIETAMDQSISSRVVVQVICRSTTTRAQLGPKRQCDKAKDAPQFMHEAAKVSHLSLFSHIYTLHTASASLTWHRAKASVVLSKLVQQCSADV